MTRLAKLLASATVLISILIFATWCPSAWSKSDHDSDKNNSSKNNHLFRGHFNKIHFNKLQFHFHMKQPFPPVRANPFINVKSAPYKAKGDGTTDDTAALQQAANDALAQNKFLFFPAGTYLHTSLLTFNSIAVTGVGGATTLLANNPTSSALVLTGANPSISNLVVSTQGLTSGPPTLTAGDIVVQNANGFTISGIAVVQGTGEVGAYVFNSNVGTINGVIFDGTGGPSDIGVLIDEASHVSVMSNLFQNEAIGTEISAVGFASQFIAVIGNQIGTSSFPTNTVGVEDLGSSTLDISNNQIQMANTNSGTSAVSLSNDDNLFISQNVTSSGAVGVSATGVGPTSGNTIAQNMIQNCGAAGILANNGTTSAIQLASNVFGECGLTDSGSSTQNAVILITGSSSSGNTTFIQNNVYQGHANGLISYITSLFHIPGANVSGNTQTQTSLPNNIP